MKKAFVGALVLGSMLFFSACGGSKPDMDDPKSVAQYNCDKMKEMMTLFNSEKQDEEKIIALSNEVEAFAKELEAHHGEKYPEFEKQIIEETNKLCPPEIEPAPLEPAPVPAPDTAGTDSPAVN